MIAARFCARRALESRRQGGVSVAAAFVFTLLLAFPLAAASITERAEANGTRTELVDGRTQTSKTFRNANGTYTTSLFSAPVHYKHGGAWKEISSRVVPVTDTPGYAWRNEANDFRVRFKDTATEGYLLLERRGKPVSFTLAGAAAATAAVNGSSVTYKRVFPGVDLRYDLTSGGAKETLILGDADAPRSYRFYIDAAKGVALSAKRLGSGGWIVNSPRSARLFELAPPTLEESTHKLGGRRARQSAVQMKVTPEDGRLAVDLTVDHAWLQNPERRFPVLLDPTIKIQPPTKEGNWDVSCGTCTAYWSPLWIGTTESEAWRATLQFNLNAIPPGAQINSAAFGLYHDSTDCVYTTSGICGQSSHTLNVHRLNKAWNPDTTTTSGLGWDAATLASYTLPANAASGWMSWDVKTQVQNWVSGTQTNYGLLIKRSTEPLDIGGPSVPGIYAYPASRAPKLDVNYTSDAVKLYKPETLHSNGADLRWSAYAYPDGHAFQSYEVHRSTNASFTPSASTLIATIGDVAVTSYHDTTAAHSKTFTYKIVTNGWPSYGQTVTLPADGHASKTLQLTPSASATYIESLTDIENCTNYGTDEYMMIGADTDGMTPPWTAIYRPLVHFDLRDIPTDATVTSANLQLYADLLPPARTVTINVHRVTSAWKEGSGWAECTGDGASWEETEGGIAWASRGGDFDPTVVASKTRTSTQTNPAWDSYTVTSAVQQWVSGQASNHGLLLKFGDETPDIAHWFTYNSDDHSSTAQRPKLALTYADGSHAQGPTVAVSAPAPSALVSGTAASITASASDDGRVDLVEFLVDDVVKATDTTAPYSGTWDSTAVAGGAHTIKARATDDAGNVATSPGVPVTVENSALPTTSVSSPAPGAAVTGTTTVSASAGDDLGVTKVEFYSDDLLIAEDTTAPYSVSWNTLNEAQPFYDGSHALTTKVYDTGGQATTSAATSVTTANTSGSKYQATFTSTEFPQSVIYDPASGTQDKHGLDVTVTNNSAAAWAASDVVLKYRWYSPDPTPEPTDGPEVSLGSDLLPGEPRTLRMMAEPPSLPDGVNKAQYRLRVDLYSKASAVWFADKGNKPLENPVIVNKALARGALGFEPYYQFVGEELGAGMRHELNVANGNSIVRWTPLSAPGRGLDTVLTLTHNALEKKCECPAGNNVSLGISSLTRFGNPIDVHPNKADEIAGRANKYIELTDADGTTHRFSSPDGITYQEPDGVHLYLRRFSTTDLTRKWALTTPDRVTYFYDSEGFPTFVEDRNGNRLTFTLQDTPPAEDPGGPKKRITKVTDAGGRDFTISYWAKADKVKSHVRGKIKRITDHSGSPLDFEYYEDGNLRKVIQRGGTNADGSFLADRSFVFTYTTSDGSGPAIPDAADRVDPEPRTPNQSTRLYSVRDPRGNETRFSYLGPGNGEDRWKLASRTDRGLAVTTYGYDITNRVTTETKPLSPVWKYGYDVEGKVTSITNPLNQVTTQTWNSDRQILRVTEPGAYVEYAYNANGYATDESVLLDRKSPATTADDVVGHTQYVYANFAFDANDVAGKWKSGRPIPHGSQLSKTTDPNGTATTSVPDDFEWIYSYDGNGNRTGTTDPEGFSSTTAFNANGTVASITDANGHVTTFPAYDTNGFATEVRDAKEQPTRASYDADGLLKWVQDPLHASDTGTQDREYRTVIDYDSFHRPGRQSDPKSTRFERGTLIWTGRQYDANDNPTADFAPDFRGAQAGPRTSTQYDAMDRPTLVTGPDTSVDPAGERTKLEYDAAGRLTHSTLPKGVMTTSNPNDFVAESVYDALDRVVTEKRLAGDGREQRRHFCFDAAGDLRWSVEPKAGLLVAPTGCPTGAPPAHTSRFEYDDAHRLVSQTNELGATHTTGYDANGNVESETDENGSRVTYAHNQRGNMVQLTVPFEKDTSGNVMRAVTSKLEYDAVGNVKREISPRAWDASPNKQTFTDFTTELQYDELDRLVRVDHPVKGAAARAHSHYAYDAVGNTSMVSLPVELSDPGLVPDDSKTTFDHYDQGWLRTSNDPANPPVRFEYDARGAQTARTPFKRGSSDLDLEQRILSEYYADGLLKRVSDRNGIGQTAYTYDANDNQVKADQSRGVVSAGQTGLDVETTYDGFDRATKVRYQRKGTANWTFSTLDYDDNGNVAERTANGEETTAGALVSAGRRHEFTHDQADQTVSATDYGTAGSSDDLRVRWTYGPVGWPERQELERSDGAGGWALKQTTDWTHYADGALQEVATKNGSASLLESHTLSFLDDDGYYANGQRTRDVFRLVGPDQGQPCRTADCTTSYFYDARDRVTKETRVRSDGSTSTTNVTSFDVDSKGNVRAEYLNGNEIRRFDYVGNQLSSVTAGGTARLLHYDSEGNVDCLTSQTGVYADCNPPEGATPSTRLLEDYAYDYLNRLAGHKRYSSGTVTDSASYIVDALDRVSSQREMHGGEVRDTLFTYVGTSPAVSEERHENGTGGLLRTKTYSHGIGDDRVALSLAEGGSTSRYSYAHNPHGDVSMLVAAENADAAYAYSVYGDEDKQLTKGDPISTDVRNAYRYSSFRYDSGSSSVDMGPRRFNTDLTRFVQRDQFEDAKDDAALATNPMTQNRYALAAGNPVGFAELDGHVPIPDGGGPRYPPVNNKGKQPSYYPFKIPRLGGWGFVRGGIFINACSIIIRAFPDLRGDCRQPYAPSQAGFDAYAPASRFRGFIKLDFNRGQGMLQMNPTCQAGTSRCWAAHKVCNVDKSWWCRNSVTSTIPRSKVKVRTRLKDPTVVGMELDAHDSAFNYRGAAPPIPAAKSAWVLVSQKNRSFKMRAAGDGFPSFEMYHFRRIGGAMRYSTLCRWNGTNPYAAAPIFPNKIYC